MTTDFFIDVREKDGLRTLHFESDRVQGAMRIDHPDELAIEYTREMMASLLMCDALPRSVLLVGLGAGSQAKFLYRHCPQAHITAVEIAARVVEAAREHFELPDDPVRLEIVVGDGFEFIRTTERTFDLILVDGFNQHAHPGDLNTRPFYEACRERLGVQGLLAVNLIGLSANHKGGYAHIETAFGGRTALFPRCRSGNTIAFAATGETIDIALDELKGRAQALEQRTGLALQPSIAKLEDAPCCPGGRLRI